MIEPMYTLDMTLLELTYLSQCLHQALVQAASNHVTDTETGQKMSQIPAPLITLHNKLADLVESMEATESQSEIITP